MQLNAHDLNVSHLRIDVIIMKCFGSIRRRFSRETQEVGVFAGYKKPLKHPLFLNAHAYTRWRGTTVAVIQLFN